VQVGLGNERAVGALGAVAVPAFSRGQIVETGLVPVVLLVVLVGLLLTTLLLRGPARRAAAVLLLPASGAWVLFNGTLEGPVLVTLTPTHGLTVSDLLAVVGVLVAAGALVGGRRSP
jgi:hypothetical protein